jgi:alkaline phosphatase
MTRAQWSSRIALLAGGFALSAASAIAADGPLVQADDPYYQRAQNQLQRNLDVVPNTRRAKNIILFVGDGMGIATVTAARIYQGQQAGRDGVSNILTFENLPYSALSRTFSDDSQVTDSAPSAAAMTTGVKSRNGTINVSSAVANDDCKAGLANQVTSIAELAEIAGMSTGAVSTARITHATPAATYAHTAGRDWESKVPDAAKAEGCIDIARQLIEWRYGDGMEVAMGGGRRNFLPSDVADPEYPDKKGERPDGRDLTREWLKRFSNSGTYIWNKAQFDALNPADVGHVLALFEPSHMQYEMDRVGDGAGEPSLAEMTTKAIAILKKDPQGFFLMVEGGRIDHAHHAGNAARALADTVAFDAAVKAALAATDARETLIIVTADHSHVFAINGYPDRNNPILGLVVEGGKLQLAKDNKPYTTLSYANGPGARVNEPREDLTKVDTTDKDFHQQSLVPGDAETHGGEDVSIYANGPWAHLFRGTVDENYIFHVMDRAGSIHERAETIIRAGMRPPKRRGKRR